MSSSTSAPPNPAVRPSPSVPSNYSEDEFGAGIFEEPRRPPARPAAAPPVAEAPPPLPRPAPAPQKDEDDGFGAGLI